MSSRHPNLDPRLFVLRGFRAGVIAFLSQFMAAFGFTFVELQFLQLVLGCSPLKSALAFLPVATVVLAVLRLTGPAHPPPRSQGRAARRSPVPGRRHALADRV
ncbi:hypothetical protein [Streptomyces sp. NPDC087856]|uniref:hypothetical protein n=1 Tax=Streptomyces sp. NPDC087856 TaxID=3365811 RepID=UPI0037F34B27